jgi:hypothetical protein
MNEKLDINVGSREKRAIILEFNIYIYIQVSQKKCRSRGLQILLRSIMAYLKENNFDLK